MFMKINKIIKRIEIKGIKYNLVGGRGSKMWIKIKIY